MDDLTQHTVPTPYMVGPVHFYSGLVNGDLALFDTGPPTEQARQYLIENIDLNRLKYIFITHTHIDHYGQARWLEENSDAIVFLPYRDCLKVEKHDWRITHIVEVLRDLGITGQYLEDMKQKLAVGELFPPMPRRFQCVEHDLPAGMGLEVLSCAGHSQGDLVYTVHGCAVTGDTVLKGIFQTPLLDVDLVQGGRFNNYRAYCATLEKLASLDGMRIMPGHGEADPVVTMTLFSYIKKLFQRLITLKKALREKELMQIVENIFAGRDVLIFHYFLKASELVFMRDFLDDPEPMQTALQRTGLLGDVKALYLAAID